MPLCDAFVATPSALQQKSCFFLCVCVCVGVHTLIYSPFVEVHTWRFTCRFPVAAISCGRTWAVSSSDGETQLSLFFTFSSRHNAWQTGSCSPLCLQETLSTHNFFITKSLHSHPEWQHFPLTKRVNYTKVLDSHHYIKLYSIWNKFLHLCIHITFLIIQMHVTYTSSKMNSSYMYFLSWSSIISCALNNLHKCRC